MAQTAAERKAEETARKKDLGLLRRSFWLNEQAIKAIEDFSKQNKCTKDEAINLLLSSAK